MSVKRAMTVLGPVPPEALGVTLTHDHLLFDQTQYASAPASTKIPDNARVDDPGLAASEASLFKQAGGSTIVDVSTRGLGRNPVGLASIARATGLNIITACGYYKAYGHPPEMSERTIEDITSEFKKEIEVGIEDTGIRAGVIGEIATGQPLYETPSEIWDLTNREDMVPNEKKVLRAAGRAQIETDAPISVHIYNYRPNRLAHHCLDILEKEGTNLERVAICHLDTRPDPDYVESIANRGAFVEFDTFGMESGDMTQDTNRIELVLETIKRGYLNHILLSQDVCWKSLLVKYGGQGYAHISKQIEPRFRSAGINDIQIQAMRVHNPARWLTF